LNRLPKDNRSVIGLAAVITIVAWIATVRSARGMSATMPMPGGWSMSMAWMGMGAASGFSRGLMFVSMWTTMMVAMMLPSVTPVVVLHRALLGSRSTRGEPAGGSNVLLLAGYFGVWTLFGVIAYAVGISVTAAAMRSSSLSRVIPFATGGLLAAAGCYQLTSWKYACLAHCRSPLEVFAHHPIRRRVDSLIVGVHHGAYCAACCWALMAIQLALGVMSLPLMASIGAVIFLEKCWKHGEAVASVVGVAAIVSGIVLIVRAVS
jgi:predicted metal-binding membrane protein